MIRRWLAAARRGTTLGLLSGGTLLVGCGGDSERSSPAEPTPRPGDASRTLTQGWETDFSRASVPLDEITSGGPPKDGIPSIDAPNFTSASDVDAVGGREPVLTVEIAGKVRGYPLQILIWHEIVNDTLAASPIVVTYCPLCNTAIVFDRRLDGRVLDFGTTGNLRNSDLVMYDRQTETWWQQFSGEAIVGQLTGKRLARVPARVLSFAEFLERFPTGEVLSRDTGFDRPYGRNPYSAYDAPGSTQLFESVNSDDRRLDPKARVVFIEVGPNAAAIPFDDLARRRRIDLTLAGRRLTVRWRPGVASALDDEDIADGRDVGAAEVTDATGRPVAFDEPLWFAVAAFRPDVKIVRR